MAASVQLFSSGGAKILFRLTFNKEKRGTNFKLCLLLSVSMSITAALVALPSLLDSVLGAGLGPGCSVVQLLEFRLLKKFMLFVRVL